MTTTLATNLIWAQLRSKGFSYDASKGEWCSPLYTSDHDLGRTFPTPDMAFAYMRRVEDRYRRGEFAPLLASLVVSE